MSSFLTLALVIAAAVAETTSIDLGKCSKFALKAATRIEFDGAVTTIKTGDIGRQI
jgi:hypothetical protein